MVRIFPNSEGKFFKILYGELVLTLVARACRIFTEPQRLQLAAHRRFVNRDLEFLKKPKRQILAAPTHNTVDCWDRPAFHDPRKGLPLCIVELGRLARRLAIE